MESFFTPFDTFTLKYPHKIHFFSFNSANKTTIFQVHCTLYSSVHIELSTISSVRVLQITGMGAKSLV